MIDTENITIKVLKESKGIYRATAVDSVGDEIANVVAFSSANAKQLLKQKLGLIDQARLQSQTKNNIVKGKHQSVMTGLVGKTSARSWGKIK